MLFLISANMLYSELEIKPFGGVPTGHSHTKFQVPAQNFRCPIFLNNTNIEEHFFPTILIHY